MKLQTIATIAAAAMAVAGCAQAAPILTGALTVDNGFYAYLSDSPSSRGTLIASGDNWGATVKIKPVRLKAGRTYYLHIEAINYGDQGALIGAFQLKGSGFHFANGRHELLTGLSSWTGGFNSGNSTVAPQAWLAAGGHVASQGANGVGPWGKVKDVAATALWIWPTDKQSSPSGPPSACPSCTVDFSTTISPDEGR